MGLMQRYLNKIKPAIWPYETTLAFFFDIQKFHKIFDRKLDHRASDSYDN